MTNHKIAHLENMFFTLPSLTLPETQTYSVTEYDRSLPSEAASRIGDADIAIITTLRLDAASLSPSATPNLRLIVVVASGTDSVDLDSCKARGITVVNSPHCNAGAVAEHAIGLYFAARRKIAPTSRALRNGEWPTRKTISGDMRGPDGRSPLTCVREVVGIVGHGVVGKKIAAMASALGMKISISGRKGDTQPIKGRSPFAQVIREATVLVLCLPRSPESMNLISTAELDAMRVDAVIINVSRGGILDERALVAALKARKIAGAAVDVFKTEPAGPENSVLLGDDTEDLNLVTTPHLAWCSEETDLNYQKTVQENITAWLEGKPKNVVV